MSNDSEHSGILSTVCILATLGSIVMGYLLVREHDRKPNEIVKEVQKLVQLDREVPVERIVEVPKEVIKEVAVIKKVEVPTELTEAQKAAIDLSTRFLSAPMVKSKDEVFYRLESVALEVTLGDGVKKVVSEERVRNRFELILRQHGIRLDEKAPVSLIATIEGLWDKDENRLTYTTAMKLRDIVTIGRKGDWRQAAATVWHEGTLGYAGKDVVEKAIMDSIEEMAESFAIKFVAIHDKEAGKSGND